MWFAWLSLVFAECVRFEIIGCRGDTDTRHAENGVHHLQNPEFLRSWACCWCKRATKIGAFDAAARNIFAQFHPFTPWSWQIFIAFTVSWHVYMRNIPIKMNSIEIVQKSFHRASTYGAMQSQLSRHHYQMTNKTSICRHALMFARIGLVVNCDCARGAFVDVCMNLYIACDCKHSNAVQSQLADGPHRLG